MLKQIPNILTFGRFFLTIVFLIMILCTPRPGAENRAFFLDIAFVLFVAAGLTDIVDGPIARKLNVASKFGRMVDPLADKALVCGTFVCFAIIGEPKLFDFGPAILAAIQWSVAGIIILREAYVTCLRHIAEARGVSFPATVSGKIKMFLQSFVIGTVIIKAAHVEGAWGDWFTAVAFIPMLAVTIVSGLRATQRNSWKRVVS